MQEIHRTAINFRLIVTLISLLAMYSFISNSYSELTFSSDFERHLNKVFHESIDPNDNIEILAHKKIDNKRIILFSSQEEGRTGIAVYKKMFIKNVYQFQTMKMADYALSTFRVDSSTGSYFFVYGDNHTINADTYIFSHNGNRIEKTINNNKSDTFDLIKLKAREIYNEPIIFLYSNERIIKNKVYIN